MGRRLLTSHPFLLHGGPANHLSSFIKPFLLLYRRYFLRPSVYALNCVWYWILYALQLFYTHCGKSRHVKTNNGIRMKFVKTWFFFLKYLTVLYPTHLFLRDNTMPPDETKWGEWFGCCKVALVVFVRAQALASWCHGGASENCKTSSWWYMQHAHTGQRDILFLSQAEWSKTVWHLKSSTVCNLGSVCF